MFWVPGGLVPCVFAPVPCHRGQHRGQHNSLCSKDLEWLVPLSPVILQNTYISRNKKNKLAEGEGKVKKINFPKEVYILRGQGDIIK
jgi:hypothetical protein